MKAIIKLYLMLLTCWTFVYCGNIRQTKVAIIGSGPAGLTAALYAARAQLSPIVLEGDVPGGNLTGTSYIENWPGTATISGLSLMENMKEHAIKAGARLLSETVTSIDLSKQPFTLITDQGTCLTCNSLILAMGSRPRKLHCPGETEYWGRGVATCATCDGQLYKGKDVIVVGGGDSAAEFASYLAKIAKTVTIIQMFDMLSASATMQLRIFETPSITIYYSHAVSEIHGNGKNISEVSITNMATHEITRLKADGLFIAIGHTPNTDLVLGQLQTDHRGHIIVHDKVKTSVPGVFAAGDIIEPIFKQAITAAGTGCIAALTAEHYLLEIGQHRLPPQQSTKIRSIGH